MATLVANGNRSVTSGAYTNNGQFEHALDSSYIKGALNSGGFKDSKKPKVFGDKTVWKNGVAYPDSYWAQIEVVPVEHPFLKGRWVHPDRVAALKREYARNTAYNKAQNATKGALNKATGAVGKEMSNISDSSTRALREYQSKNWRYSKDKGREYTGNIVGESAARLRGAVGGSAAAKAAKNEASNISKGANAARQAYIDAHTNVQIPPKDGIGYPEFKSYSGSKLGETAAAIRGGVGASAVGRAGKAAFEALTNKFEDFKSGINKYLTGENAGKNRGEALSKLRETAGGLIGAIGSALGTSKGRSETLSKAASAIGTVTGGAAGVARGIASSNIGQAAINAGHSAYGAVKDKIGSALDAITSFFKKKKPALNKNFVANTVNPMGNRYAPSTFDAPLRNK